MYTSISLGAAAGLAAGVQAQIPNTTNGYINYTTVQGYFLQDVSTTNATTLDYVSPTQRLKRTETDATRTATNFGLINRTYPATNGLTANYTQWQKFEAQVNALNADAPLNTAYKVLFMGRHGEGYHNAAQTFYGTPGWNCYWAEINGNATAEWFDADLTPNGIDQALIAHDFWAREFETQKIPYPQSYYTSPLTRCLKTANYTFAGLELPQYYPFVPEIKELLREGISIHTCDHRRSRTYIHELFPSWEIEPSLTEYDELWNGVTAETSDAQDARSKKVLDSIFSVDDHTWISITSHSGEIASILRTIGHQSFSLSTGAVIPVLVKAEFLPSGPPPSDPPYSTSTHCAAPPATSISSLAQGCVCSGTAVGGITYPIYNISSDYPSGAGYQATDLAPPVTSTTASSSSYGA